MRRLRELTALGLLAVAAATVLPGAGWNATAHYSLVESMADGSPYIDDNLNQGGDIAWLDGHFYSAKAPGLALASVPLYVAFDAAGLVPAQAETETAAPGAETVIEEAVWEVNLVIVAAFLGLLLLMRAVAERVAPGTGAGVALLLGLGTMLLPFATSYFAHVLSATLAFAAFSLLFYERRRASAPALAGAGLLAGLAVVVEQPLVLAAAVLGLYAVAGRPRARRAALYGGGLVAGIVPLAAYNIWAFGSPFESAYSNAVLSMGETGHDVVGANDEGLFGLTYPHLDRGLDLLFDQRGLFVLTPVVVAALAGLWPLARRGYRLEALVAGGLALAFWLYNASYYLPFGGHVPGPRFLVPVLPFLALPLAAALRRWPLVTLAAGALSAFWMTAATLAGPLIPPTESPTSWISDIVHREDLAGTILTGGGRFALLAFAIPALAAVCLVAVPEALASARARAGLTGVRAARGGAR